MQRTAQRKRWGAAADLDTAQRTAQCKRWGAAADVDSRLYAVSRVAALVLVAASSACHTPDPRTEISLSEMETYWAVDRPVGGTQYLAPVVRFRLHNKGAEAHYSIQATGTFRRKGETQTWSGAYQQVAPMAGKALDPGASTLVVLKPEGEGRYTSTVPPEDMLAHEQFKDVWVEVFVRVGRSGWSKLAQADVERRIGARVVAAAP